MKTFKNMVVKFCREEDGAQVVEYALIIAAVSIALVGALELLAGPGNPFAAFVGRVNLCLTTANCI